MTYALLPAEKVVEATTNTIDRMNRERSSGAIYDPELFSRLENLKALAEASLFSPANMGVLRISSDDFGLIKIDYKR